MQFLLHWLSWTGYQLNTGSGNEYQSEQVIGFPPSQAAKPRNYAALIPSEKAQLEVAGIPYPECGDDELIIKNHVVGVNPIDWKVQSGGFGLEYPVVMGEDVAGEILEVGTNAKHNFHVGQRVMAHTVGFDKGSSYGGFQLYPVLRAAITSPIPDDLSFTEAAVLPLSISTAAAGLFMNATLGLNSPKTDTIFSLPSTHVADNPVLLLWGGSSSVGSSVIQLASAAGYTVITTSSSSNFKYCKELGAAHVLDYHDPEVVPKLINLLKGNKVVGAYDAIGSVTTVLQCASVLEALGGGKISSVGAAPSNLPPKVTLARISGGALEPREPTVAMEVWGTYVPWALKSGRLLPRPKALIVGKGLENVQKGLDRQKEGVSAKKVVIAGLAK
ncbi:GroES-like protein [Mollisia scopiformis]|uniref:GroES-like protein n=1 Tax=Mollisia scopiformis TaxID=149040 RepID=A0A194XGX6_MOLSC|nr:GroES-like protein [Mollisia scopiformis]KUJ19384.1 GroES-like protein [Mollisia scopiformis]